MEVDSEGKKLWQQIIETVTVYSSKNSRASKFDNLFNHAKPYKNASNVGRRGKYKRPNIDTSRGKESHTSICNQLDRATNRKLLRGKIRPDATIDLHDMTQDQAYNALINFVRKSISLNKRTLLVITGKGKNLTGVLRQKLPLWLESSQFANNIISISSAAKRDGGEGAFYIRLKNTNKFNR